MNGRAAQLESCRGDLTSEEASDFSGATVGRTVLSAEFIIRITRISGLNYPHGMLHLFGSDI
jgi:hypothetical protein